MWGTYTYKNTMDGLLGHSLVTKVEKAFAHKTKRQAEIGSSYLKPHEGITFLAVAWVIKVEKAHNCYLCK